MFFTAQQNVFLLDKTSPPKTKNQNTFRQPCVSGHGTRNRDTSGFDTTHIPFNTRTPSLSLHYLLKSLEGVEVSFSLTDQEHRSYLSGFFSDLCTNAIFQIRESFFLAFFAAVPAPYPVLASVRLLLLSWNSPSDPSATSVNLFSNSLRQHLLDLTSSSPHHSLIIVPLIPTLPRHHLAAMKKQPPLPFVPHPSWMPHRCDGPHLAF